MQKFAVAHSCLDLCVILLTIVWLPFLTSMIFGGFAFREIYINYLSDEESISNIIKFEELLDDQTNRDINGMVNVNFSFNWPGFNCCIN
jgi:hypothetical protein